MIDLTKLVCKKCGHVWIPRQNRFPIACPKCNNKKWNKKK